MPQLSVNQRTRIIALKAEGKQVEEIMKTVGCAKRTVYKWINRWNEASSISNKKVDHCRRKLSLNENQQTKLIEYLDGHRYATRNEIIEALNLDCVPQTVGRYIKKLGYGTFVAAVEPDLEPKHKKQRILFCESNLNLNWSNVVASDEKTLQNYKSGRTQIKRKRNERYKLSNIVKKNKNGRCKLNLWSYISSNGLGKLYNVSPKYNSKLYCETLDDALIDINNDNPNFILLQDGARHHTSKYTKSYLANNLKVYNEEKKIWEEKKNSINKNVPILKDYPARSPDLNILENIWSVFQSRYNKLVLKIGQPKNKKSLWIYARYVWNNLRKDKELVRKLFDSYPQRVRKIIYKKGECSQY